MCECEWNVALGCVFEFMVGVGGLKHVGDETHQRVEPSGAFFGSVSPFLPPLDENTGNGACHLQILPKMN